MGEELQFGCIKKIYSEKIIGEAEKHWSGVTN